MKKIVTFSLSGVVKHNQEKFFNVHVFRRRIEISAEIFLLEANGRGRVR